MSILIPIVLSLIFPLLLWVGGLLQIAPNERFKISAIIIMTVWTVISLYFLDDVGSVLFGHWLAGLLLIASAVILVFLPWSVLCWGYTLTMLLRIAERNRPVNQDQWANDYAGSLGVRGLSKNRATVLLGLGFALVEGENIVLTPRGRFSADCLRRVSQFFGVSQ